MVLRNWDNGCTLNATKAYYYLRTKRPKPHWTTAVWNTTVQPKQSFILWLAVKGKLRTRDKLSYLKIDKTCGLCNGTEETSSHLFFSCRFCSCIWQHISCWIGNKRRSSTLLSALKWIKKSRGTGWQSKVKIIALASTVYHI